LTFLPLLANAEAVEIDGVYYNLIAKAQIAEVTYNPNGYRGDLVIPETVTYEDVIYTVTSIGPCICLFSNELTSITIPKTVKTINDGSFLLLYLNGYKQPGISNTNCA